MSAEENKALVRRFYDEVINKGNLSVADDLGSNDFVDHSPMPGLAANLEGTKQGIAMISAAFPDLHVAVEDIIAEGDKTVARITFRGTHKGELMGTPATGKQVTWSAMDFVRFKGGKAVEHWGEQDMLGMMQQLGVATLPGQAGG